MNWTDILSEQIGVLALAIGSFALGYSFARNKFKK